MGFIFNKYTAPSAPGGADNSFQYNNAGTFAGIGSTNGTDADFTPGSVTASKLIAKTLNTLVLNIDNSNSPYSEDALYGSLMVDIGAGDVAITLGDVSTEANEILQICTYNPGANTKCTVTGTFANPDYPAIVLYANDSLLLQSDSSRWQVISWQYLPYTQSVSPANGATVQSNNARDCNLLVNNAAIAALTIKFPLAPQTGDEFSVCFKSTVTVLTLNGNGNTIIGNFVAVTATSAYTWIFDGNTTWWLI